MSTSIDERVVQMRFDNARLQFMRAIDANGNADIAKQVKEAYSRAVD